eukprot:12933940-Prorocentrum_lima.AAC.1
MGTHRAEALRFARGLPCAAPKKIRPLRLYTRIAMVEYSSMADAVEASEAFRCLDDKSRTVQENLIYVGPMRS